MINFTLGVDLGSPSMKYPKNGFKIINITQIPKMNPARGFCFIVEWFIQNKMIKIEQVTTSKFCNVMHYNLVILIIGIVMSCD